MLTQKFVTFSGNIFHFLCIHQASPFDWNSSTQRLKVTTESRRNFLWTKLFTSNAMVVFFFRAIECKLNGDQDNFFVIYCFFLVSLLYAITSFCVVVHIKDISVLYNAMLQYMSDIQRIYIPDIDSKRNNFEKLSATILLSVVVSLSLTGLGYSVHFLLFPTHPLHGYSLVYYLWKKPVLEPALIVLYLSLQLFLIFHIVSFFICLITVVLAVLLQSLPLITKELHIGLKGYRAKDSLRKIRNLFKVYRRCEIFVKLWMIIFGRLFIPFQFLCGQIGLISFVVPVKISHSSDIQAQITLIFVGFFSQLFWFGLLKFGGVLCRKGAQGLQSWKFLRTDNQSESKYAKKVRKSFKPLQIGQLGVFTIKPLTFPKYVYGLTKSIFRALLAFEKKSSFKHLN